MNRFVLLVGFFLPFYVFSQLPATGTQPRPLKPERDYSGYYRIITKAQELIANQKYEEALAFYKQLSANYDFIFLRDYKLATQLAVHVGRTNDAFAYLKKGISGGWDIKSIRKNKVLEKLKRYPEWKNIENQTDSLREVHQKRSNPELRAMIKKMFGKDQRKAFGALFMFSSKGQDRYAEKKFAPHSEKQVAKLNEIMKTYGYPGENLIGNGLWASVILSHHNSISEKYAAQDTLYPHSRPKLLKAVESGEMSPYEFAMIDDWYVAVRSNRKEKRYGYLDDTLTEAERVSANQLREKIGLSPVETINGLIDIQQQTGMNMYLPFNSNRKTIILP
ncbi:hypothetical protein [Spirosoma areae]